VRTEEVLTARDAAETVAAVQWRYAQAGLGLAQAALAGAHRFEVLRHYPARDAANGATGSSFYYHAHGSRRRPHREHGHFHVFQRDADAGFFHVAALSLDARGLPLRWFTTNRWVTGERWADAAEVIDALPRVRLAARGRLAPVARWLDAMLRLYGDTLITLVRRRDRVVAARSRRQGRGALFEDRRLDVLTETRVDLPQRLQRLSTVGPG
jgi:hypothetical protein